MYGEVKPDPEPVAGWTAEDRKILQGIEQAMTSEAKKATVERMEELKSRPEAATQKRQDALDVIIKMFSETEGSEGDAR